MAILKGADSLRPVNWLQAGLNKAKCVGRIKGPSAVASSFLIDGEAIGPGFAEVPVLITADFVFDGSNAQDYAVAFEGLFDEVSAPAEVRVQQVVWSSRTLHAAVCGPADWPGAVRGLKPGVASAGAR